MQARSVISVLLLLAVSSFDSVVGFQVHAGGLLRSSNGVVRNSRPAVSMQLGGGGLKGLGGNREEYYKKLQERKEKLEQGEGSQSMPTSDLLAMISENEDELFGMVGSEISQSEVDRLTTANLGKGKILEKDDEDDPELEKALLQMFIEQGDVSPDVLLEKKAEEASKKTYIELDQPLDLESSQELLKAMNKYDAIEKGVWDEVRGDMKDGSVDVPEEVTESFELKTDAQKAAEGVEVTTTKEGDGKTFPKSGDTLAMHYKGTLAADGSKFDSSYDRGSPFKFKIGVGQVIKGWDEGVVKMSLGEKATLNISPEFGYGARGFPPVIPPNSELVFEVELLQINDKKA